MSGFEPLGAPDQPSLHVAIIMDGNGRWAGGRSLPRSVGHFQGVEAVRRTVKASLDLGLTHLTLFGFSCENWSRPQEEIFGIFGLLRHFLKRDIAALNEAHVRVVMLGEKSGLPEDLQHMIGESEEKTKSNQALILSIAFNYGGRQEMVRVAQRLAKHVQDGTLVPEAITLSHMQDALDLPWIPDVDLLIRTSGEQRLSNFLLWQLAYTELVFLPVYWPDFTRAHLEEALALFSERQRRFGGVLPALSLQKKNHERISLP